MIQRHKCSKSQKVGACLTGYILAHRKSLLELTRTSGDVAHSSILFLSDPCRPGLIFFCYISIDNVYIDTSYFCLYPLNPTTRILHSSSSSSFSVTKIRAHFPLTLFLKYDQLDLFKASGIISDYLTSIFPKHFLIF